MGQSLNVLWETAVGADESGLRWTGYTDNYIRVAARGPADLFNTVTRVEIEGAEEDGVYGRVIHDA